MEGDIQESKNNKPIIIVFFLLRAADLYIKQGLVLCHISANHAKQFPKILPMAMSVS